MPIAPTTVYVVDDDFGVLGSLRFLLETDGFEVRTFRSGAALLDAVAENDIDCIVVDYSIGRIDAQQICQNLRRNTEYADTIVIALLPDDGSPMSFDRSSINETFKKPFDAKLLAERLRTLIGAKKELV